MFSNTAIENFIIFNIKTVSEYPNLDELHKYNPVKAELWSKRCEWFRKRYEENKDMTDEELYIEKAALQAEFGKIVCISIGKIDLLDNESTISIKSYDNENEKELLRQFAKNSNSILKKLPTIEFIGFNSNRFDVPYITKRCFINNINIPIVLKTFGIKPWESMHKDFVEIWSGGAWQESYIPFALVIECLNIDKLDGDFDESETGKIYWIDNNLQKIVKKSKNDVFYLANCILKISDKKMINVNNILFK